MASIYRGIWLEFIMTASVYLARTVDGVTERRMRHHPAILIVGPRATGKTTTAERFARTTIQLDRPGEAAVWLRDQLGERFLGGAVLHTGLRAFQLDTKIVAAPIATLWS